MLSYSLRNVKGFRDLVSHILVSSVMIPITHLYIFQVCPQHFQNDFQISAEQKCIFCHKEIAAFLAQTGNINTTSTGAELSIFHDHALMTGSGKTALNQIGEGALQIKYRRPLPDHL